MPPGSNTVVSSYAEIASTPRKSPEITGPKSKTITMEPPTDTLGREDSSKKTDSKHDESAAPEKIDDPPVDPSAGAPDGYPQVVPPHDTPQQHNYYGMYGNSQVTPESPSPNNTGGRAIYNGGSFFQPQPGAGFQSSPFTNDATHPYSGAGASQPPSSPTQSMGGIPPASPLFPRMTGGMPPYLNSRGGDAQGISPVPSYASSNGMYIPGTYPMIPGRPNGSSSTASGNTMNSSNVSEEFMGWNDNR